MTTQEQFDKTYISSSEIAKIVQVSRVAVSNAVVRGLLPDPISINNGTITIFEREKVMPYVNSWLTILNAKRAAK